MQVVLCHTTTPARRRTSPTCRFSTPLPRRPPLLPVSSLRRSWYLAHRRSRLRRRLDVVLREPVLMSRPRSTSLRRFIRLLHNAFSTSTKVSFLPRRHVFLRHIVSRIYIFIRLCIQPMQTLPTSCARGDTICPAPLLPPWAQSPRVPPSRSNLARRIRSHADRCSRLTR